MRNYNNPINWDDLTDIILVETKNLMDMEESTVKVKQNLKETQDNINLLEEFWSLKWAS